MLSVIQKEQILMNDTIYKLNSATHSTLFESGF